MRSKAASDRVAVSATKAVRNSAVASEYNRKSSCDGENLDRGSRHVVAARSPGASAGRIERRPAAFNHAGGVGRRVYYLGGKPPDMKA